MSGSRTYAGPVEALTLEEAAVRCRISPDHFKKHYTGKFIKIGANVRVHAADLYDWLDALAGDTMKSDPWAGVGDAEESPLSGRKSGKAA